MELTAWLGLLIVLVSTILMSSPLWAGYLLLKRKSRFRYWLMKLAETRELQRQMAPRRASRVSLPFLVAIPLHFALSALICLNIYGIDAQLWESSDASERWILSVILAVGATAYLCWTVAYRCIRPGDDDPATANMRTAFGLVSGLTTPIAVLNLVCSLLLLAPSVLVVVARYLLGDRLAKEPILYLRSFHDKDAATAFGGMINNITSRFGVVVGLVRVDQRPSELHRLGSFFNRARFQTIPDEWWQDWVTAQLQRCSTLVIDITVSTPSVLWEMDQALAMVPRERILVLREHGASVASPAGISTIDYSVGRIESDLIGEHTSPKKAQKEIEHWFSKQFYGDPDSNRAQLAGNVIASAGVAVVILCILAGIFLDDEDETAANRSAYELHRATTREAIRAIEEMEALNASVPDLDEVIVIDPSEFGDVMDIDASRKAAEALLRQPTLPP